MSNPIRFNPISDRIGRIIRYPSKRSLQVLTAPSSVILFKHQILELADDINDLRESGIPTTMHMADLVDRIGWWNDRYPNDKIDIDKL